MADADLAVTLGRVRLKNPLICGSGEHVMYRNGIEAALKQGAAAVVIKSINESSAAKEQLLRADYALYDSSWRRLNWDFSPPPDATLFCRSGLAQQSFEEWLELLAAADKAARARDAYVIASLIPAASDATLDYARRIEQAGVRILEVNIGAPHAEEAAADAITHERDAARVEAVTRKFREIVSIPLWIKLTGQGSNIDALAAAARKGGADSVTIMGRFMAFLPDAETMAPALSTRAAIGGAWALPLACDWIRKSRSLVGADFPLIGANGARNGLDIARFMLAGASGVQMTSAIFTGGFDAVGSALADFERYIAGKGLRAAEIIGLAADRLEDYEAQPARNGYWEQFVPKGGGAGGDEPDGQ